MEWRDEGIILGTRRHGETSAILEVMTRGHGRHMGLVRGGRSRSQRPVLQVGNRVELTWRARLDEHLGNYTVEPLELNAARLLDSAAAVYALQTLAAHLRLLPERDPHQSLYEVLGLLLGHLGRAADAAELIVRFELLLLDELGFGLDLSRCAATGSRDDLAWVSPRTGRAVSREAGRPWADRMLALPTFLRPGSGLRGELVGFEDAFRLTGHFLHRHVYEPRGIAEPEARGGFLGTLRRELAQDPVGNGEHAA